MARRALSLHARQLLAASLGLVAFLGFTGIALDHAFLETAQSNLRERLQSYAYAYVGDIDFDTLGNLVPPLNRSPDIRFDLVGSGLYAKLVGVHLHGPEREPLHWESPSLLGQEVPPPPAFKSGNVQFDGPIEFTDSHGLRTGMYRFTKSIIYESGQVGRTSEIAHFTFSVYEDASQIDRQVVVFRRALWSALGLAAVLLLVVQMLVLRWSLQPLRRVTRELARVQGGSIERMSGHHPRELRVLTDSINAFIVSERENLDRYRNTLSDLAHSLKTPLAVLRSRLESDAPADELRMEVRAQVQRMSEIVSYQLSRGATTGHQLFAAPLEIETRAEGIVTSLEKVYASKRVLCEFDLDPAARFYGAEGDLMELLGNLLENAFKWARQRVILTTRNEIARGRRSGLVLIVEDDGPGIPPDQADHLLQRGVRGDERVQGHGIGLSIVQNIVRAYHGELDVDGSTELGGARFVVRIPPGPLL
jgi:two-component system sensor histidine kinase PhoQ